MGTLDEIAKAAGVSRMTVSNVLNGKNKETWSSTAERAERIREIARELNYRPNAAAKAVVTGRFGGIGLLLSRNESSGTLFPSTFRAVREALGERDLHLTVGDLPDAQLTNEQFVPKILREWAADGLLINYIASIPPRMQELIDQHHIPSVWLNTRLEHNCVFPDDYAAAAQATQHLIELGHRRIAFLQNAVSSHYSVQERENGYRKAMQSARLQPVVIGYQDTPQLPKAQEFSRSWLLGPDRPTAVVSYELNYALPVYCAAMQLGLQVPRDLSIITMHEKEASEYGVDLSTMLIPGAVMGNRAVEMIVERIKNPSVPLQSSAIAFTFTGGASCAPPGGG
jgi:LacI family transcriptional regulator